MPSPKNVVLEGNSRVKTQSGVPPSKAKLDRNLLLGLGLLMCATILFALNYWHSMSCFNAHSTDEIEEMGKDLKHRLLTAESQTLKSSIFLEKVIGALQKRLVDIEDREMEKLVLHDQDEATKTQLLLAKQPSPLKHTYQLHEKYQDAEVLADRVTELLKLVDNEQKRGEHSAHDIFGFGGKDDDDFFWKEKEDDQWKGKSGKSSFQGNGNMVKRSDDYNGGGGSASSGTGSSMISEEEAKKLCNEWHKKFNVVPSASWGDLPDDYQKKWLKIQCDRYLTVGSTDGAY